MLIDELYGSESISEVVIIFYLFAQRITQIYRIMVAWLDNLSDMYSVKFLLYSDNYHLGEYAENPERVSLNSATEHLRAIGKYVNKFSVEHGLASVSSSSSPSPSVHPFFWLQPCVPLLPLLLGPV